MSWLRFSPTISPIQGSGPLVVCFTATPSQVGQIARIERIGRDDAGKLTGFQRPQIAAHIREIRDYLQKSDAMLPNAIVLAFSDGARISRNGTFSVDISNGPPGWVVDGQQRLAAAFALPKNGFQFIVSAFVCKDRKELNRQFILINNTRPLAKPLIYELLPGIAGLPQRLSDRVGAALLTEGLNYRPESPLRGLINQQTNPDGLIKDTLLQRLLINSLQNGALRTSSDDEAILDRGYHLVSAFFAAVRHVFSADWEGHTAKTSRLLHGAGIVAMGYVMDELSIRQHATKRKHFETGLQPLVGRTHWTSGEWNFGSERRRWNSLQNTKADYRLLSHHLVRLVRRQATRKRYTNNGRKRAR
jgi:DGQHR domain-containing protein